MSFSAEIFGTNSDLSWWQECARAVVILFYGLALVRVAGRRVFGKWSALDIVVSIIVGSNLSRALTGSASMMGTLLATTLLMLLHWILAQLAARSPRVSELLEGAQIVLVRDGKVDRARLRKQSISHADLNEALRQQSLEHVGHARLISLEPSGKITVLKAD
jgi:uncharacterized membrane protein YcaP (DUF421 family)